MQTGSGLRRDRFDGYWNGTAWVELVCARQDDEQRAHLAGHEGEQAVAVVGPGGEERTPRDGRFWSEPVPSERGRLAGGQDDMSATAADRIRSVLGSARASSSRA